MMVKVCGITVLDDALAAAAGGASALGFNFYPRSPRYVTPDRVAQMCRELPGNVIRVGVFVNESAAEVERVAGLCGLDVVQLHGDEGLNDLPPGRRVWKAVRPGTVPQSEHPAEAFLYDTPTADYGGSGQMCDWGAVPRLDRPVILAGGLDAENVHAAIRAVRPWGVDACSRLESAPGRKDHSKLAAFLRAALEGWR